MSSSGVFVTGTGTNVGKTFVSVRLVHAARANHTRVLGWKPIETGCSIVDGNWVGADQEALAVAAGDWQQAELRRLYCFETPVAPLAAARLEHRAIDMSLIERTFERGRAESNYVVVEGAGGWRVPITESDDMSGLARRLQLPVVVVATSTLGTINHTLLTVEAIERDGCVIEQVILSRHPTDDLNRARDNAAEIGRCWKGRVLLSDDL